MKRNKGAEEVLYTKDYKIHQEGSRLSAKEIIPLVLELIQPKRVIDVGCGVGGWLSVFKECGVEDILGIDGDWADKKMLQIPEERFLSFDLKEPFRITSPFRPNFFLHIFAWSIPPSDQINISLPKF